jgi:hypothetical protein
MSKHRTTRARATTTMLAAATLLLSAACADATFGPHVPSAGPTNHDPAFPTGVVMPWGDGQVHVADADPRAPELGSCGDIAAPAGTTLAQHAYAAGVQVYRWNGTAWTFVAPIATLYANAGLTGKVGTHYAGPTWQHNGGSLVKAALVTPCPVGGGNIPWLLLGATTTETQGAFKGVTHIQRVNTVGGVAPAAPGTMVGEERHVPYTAEYYFYRAK